MSPHSLKEENPAPDASVSEHGSIAVSPSGEATVPAPEAQPVAAPVVPSDNEVVAPAGETVVGEPTSPPLADETLGSPRPTETVVTGGAATAASTAPPQTGSPETGKTTAAAPKAASRSTASPAPKKNKPKKPAISSLTAPGPAEKLFHLLAYAGLPLLLVCACVPGLHLLFGAPAGWLPLVGETTYAAVYAKLQAASWGELLLGGAPYAVEPSLYYALLAGLDRLPGLDGALLFYVGGLVAGALFAAAVWVLGVAVRQGRDVAFAAGLMALTCVFAGVLFPLPGHYLLFGALECLALACFFRGWRKSSAPGWLTLAFVLSGIAALSGGLIGIAIPVVASIVFLVWKGTPGRLNGRDGLLGFFLMLLMLAVWVGVMAFRGHGEYLGIQGNRILHSLGGFGTAEVPWWIYLAALPVLWLPWMLLPLFINWLRTFKEIPASWKNRKEEGGRGWLWLTLLAALGLLTCLRVKDPFLLIVCLPPAAVLSARALLRLSPGRSRWFFWLLGLMGVLLGLAGILLEFAPRLLPLLPAHLQTYFPPTLMTELMALSGRLYMGVILVVLGFGLLLVVRRSLPGGSVLVTCLGLLALVVPYTLLGTPWLLAHPPAVLGPLATPLVERAPQPVAPAPTIPQELPVPALDEPILPVPAQEHEPLPPVVEEPSAVEMAPNISAPPAPTPAAEEEPLAPPRAAETEIPHSPAPVYEEPGTVESSAASAIDEAAERAGEDTDSGDMQPPLLPESPVIRETEDIPPALLEDPRLPLSTEESSEPGQDVLPLPDTLPDASEDAPRPPLDQVVPEPEAMEAPDTLAHSPQGDSPQAM